MPSKGKKCWKSCCRSRSPRCRQAVICRSVRSPALADVTAAVLVAKIVAIDRFETAENLVGYFGVFPQEFTSGVDRNGKPRRGRQSHVPEGQ